MQTHPPPFSFLFVQSDGKYKDVLKRTLPPPANIWRPLLLLLLLPFPCLLARSTKSKKHKTYAKAMKDERGVKLLSLLLFSYFCVSPQQLKFALEREDGYTREGPHLAQSPEHR